MLKFSVITICHNDAVGLAATIRSIGNQSYPYIESIVQDRGSTDFSLEITKGYRDWVDVVSTGVDTGIQDAMRTAADLATGDFAIFLNSSDLFTDNDVLDLLAETMVETDVILQEYVRSTGFSRNPRVKESSRRALVAKTELLRSPQFKSSQFNWDALLVADDQSVPGPQISAFTVRDLAVRDLGFELLRQTGVEHQRSQVSMLG